MKPHQKIKFDSEGYQIKMVELNGEALPKVSKLKIVPRSRAGVPPVEAVKKALKGLRKDQNFKALIAARKSIGYTQERFAGVLHVNLGTYRQWEQGRRALTGPARALVKLVAMRPELVKELEEDGQ